jgi:hypothetical protein
MQSVSSGIHKLPLPAFLRLCNVLGLDGVGGRRSWIAKPVFEEVSLSLLLLCANAMYVDFRGTTKGGDT